MEEEGSEQRGLKVRQVWTQLFGHWHCYEIIGETRLASRAHRNYVLWILRVSLDAFPPLRGHVYLCSKQNYVGLSYDSKLRLCNPQLAQLVGSPEAYGIIAGYEIGIWIGIGLSRP